MSPRRRRRVPDPETADPGVLPEPRVTEPAEPTVPVEPTVPAERTEPAAPASAAPAEPSDAVPASAEADERHLIDLVPDELSLARSQLDAGQPGLAEGTLRRRLAWLEAEGRAVGDEPDALRALLAEALWRMGRPMAARQALDGIRASSPQRRLPTAMIVEAEALAVAGEPDRAAGLQERVTAAVGVDAVFELRAGVAGRLEWPLPAELEPHAARPARAPWSERSGTPPEAGDPAETDAEPAADGERIAAGRARLEEARVAYVAGDRERGDAEMSLALRLDPGLAADGVAILEPTLGRQAPPERLLLYGDLLRAAGREVEAAEAFDRAASQRS